MQKFYSPKKVLSAVLALLMPFGCGMSHCDVKAEELRIKFDKLTMTILAATVPVSLLLGYGVGKLGCFIDDKVQQSKEKKMRDKKFPETAKLYASKKTEEELLKELSNRLKGLTEFVQTKDKGNPGTVFLLMRFLRSIEHLFNFPVSSPDFRQLCPTNNNVRNVQPLFDAIVDNIRILNPELRARALRNAFELVEEYNKEYEALKNLKSLDQA